MCEHEIGQAALAAEAQVLKESSTLSGWISVSNWSVKCCFIQRFQSQTCLKTEELEGVDAAALAQTLERKEIRAYKAGLDLSVHEFEDADAAVLAQALEEEFSANKAGVVYP